MSATEYRLRSIEKKIGTKRISTIVVATEKDGELYVDGKKWNRPEDWDEKRSLLVVLTREKYPYEM